MLNVHEYVSRTMVLGPFARFGLWVQGCHKACPNCMAPDSRDFAQKNYMPVSTLVEMIINDRELEGITISGGEPFLQAMALIRLLDAIKIKRDLGVILYTGYSLNELRLGHQWCSRVTAGALLSLVDVLIDGPYLAAADDDQGLRGSGNQHIHCFTGRYRQHIKSMESQPRKIEIHIRNYGIFAAGLRSSATTGLLTRLLKG